VVLLTAQHICTLIISPRYCKICQVFIFCVPLHPDSHSILYISSHQTWYWSSPWVILHLYSFSNLFLIACCHFILLQALGIFLGPGASMTPETHLCPWGSGKLVQSHFRFGCSSIIQILSHDPQPTCRSLSHLTPHYSSHFPFLCTFLQRKYGNSLIYSPQSNFCQSHQLKCLS
jgi:hypothetical protein